MTHFVAKCILIDDTQEAVGAGEQETLAQGSNTASMLHGLLPFPYLFVLFSHRIRGLVFNLLYTHLCIYTYPIWRKRGGLISLSGGHSVSIYRRTSSL